MNFKNNINANPVENWTEVFEKVVERFDFVVVVRARRDCLQIVLDLRWLNIHSQHDHSRRSCLQARHLNDRTRVTRRLFMNKLTRGIFQESWMLRKGDVRGRGGALTVCGRSALRLAVGFPSVISMITRAASRSDSARICSAIRSPWLVFVVPVNTALKC